MKRKSRRFKEWIAISLILLLAATLRLWALGDVPPGLAHDEVANWLIAHDILAGHHAIYFTAAYGHEPLYQYVQATTVALLGDHWLGLRWPSVAFGLLSIAATYTLIRRLFGAPIALLTIAWLAVSFWPIFYARVALRAITLPFTAALTAYFLFRAAVERRFQNINGSRKLSGVANWLLAGIFLGLSLYTYMAARILPVILVTFLIYSFLVHSSTPLSWPRVLVFLLTAATVSAPLVIWLATHPGAEYRIAEVGAPLDQLLTGDPSLAWQNLIANLEFFTIAGDPWPRQNIPGRPVFADPISAVLFYVGLLIAIWRWRDPRYGFLLIWLVGALAPSVATSVAPSSIRNILGLVVVFVFPTLALVEVGHWLKRKMQDARHKIQVRCRFLPPASCILLLASRFLLPASCFLLLAPCLLLTVRDYFLIWPLNDVVRFDYQADLTAVAHRLDKLPPETPVTVAGLSVHSMDRPSLELATRRYIHNVRLCDTRETLLIPGGRDVWLFVPQIVPFDADLQERLLEWGAVAPPPWGRDKRGDSFTSYYLSDDAALRYEEGESLQRLKTTTTLPDGTPVPLPVSFGGRLTFLGYEWLQRSPTPGDSLVLLTYWRVEEPPSTPLKIFVHLLGESDAPIVQHDRLGSSPQGWVTGDWIIQKHTLSLPLDLSPGLYILQLGLYNAPIGSRLSVASADRLLLSPVEVNTP